MGIAPGPFPLVGVTLRPLPLSGGHSWVSQLPTALTGFLHFLGAFGCNQQTPGLVSVLLSLPFSHPTSSVHEGPLSHV